MTTTPSAECASFRRLPGIVSDENLFCIHPDGNTAFIYDIKQNCFVHLSINDGKTNRFETEQRKKIIGLQGWIGIRAIVCYPKTFIIALIMEEETKRYFLVLFSASDMSVIDEHYIGITAEKTEEAQICYLTADENAQIYFVSYNRRDVEKGTQTLFDVVKIDVDNDGNITSQVLLKRYLLFGTWFRPFVKSDAITFIDRSRKMNQNLISVSFSSKKIVKVAISNDNANWPNKVGYPTWYDPTIIKDQIFYYLTEEEKKQGFIVYCDWKLKCWKQLHIDMKEHTITDSLVPLASNNVDRIFLHGQCSLEFCQEKAHVFVIEIKSDLEKGKDSLQMLSSPDAETEKITAGNINQANLQPKVIGALTQRNTEPTTAVSSIISKFNQIQAGNLELKKPDWRSKSEASKNNDGIATGAASTRTAKSQSQKITSDSDRNAAQVIHAKGRQSSEWTPINYKKEEELGSGQFGVVYKCWDTERRRYFVAKYTILQSNQTREIAENEVKRLKDLSHNRIIDYYGCEMENQTLVIFMEYMPLGSIRQMIEKHGAISENTAIIYTEQILEGLAYIHDKGIIHSDLKCDNLLSDTNGNVKIGDFGIAVQRILKADHSYINSKSANTGGGTMFWMAPEVFQTQTVSRKSDMWSVNFVQVFINSNFFSNL